MSILSNCPMRLPGPLPTLGSELGGAPVLGSSEVLGLVLGGSVVLVGSSELVVDDGAGAATPDGVPAVLVRKAPMAYAVTTPARARTSTTAVITRARRPVRLFS